MPRGNKSKYTSKQKRQARHIEEGYERRGLPGDEAERRAWATVNKESGGGLKGGRKSRRAAPTRAASRKKKATGKGKTARKAKASPRRSR